MGTCGFIFEQKVNFIGDIKYMRLKLGVFEYTGFISGETETHIEILAMTRNGKRVDPHHLTYRKDKIYKHRERILVGTKVKLRRSVKRINFEDCIFESIRLYNDRISESEISRIKSRKKI